MKHLKLLPLLASIGALLLFAAPAEAKPTGKDARAAVTKARQAVAASLAATGSGEAGAAELIGAASRLQAKAARLALRVGAVSDPARGARLIRSAAAGVDHAFGCFAELIAQAPPELQPYLLEALSRLEATRSELIAELTGFVESLPADLREQILAAIATFQDDGDLKALIAALSGGELLAPVQAGLQELVAQLTTTLGAQIGQLGELGELLPPGAVEHLQAMLAQIEQHLERALERLTAILAPPSGGSAPPVVIPGGLCEQLEVLLGGFGLPVPPGLCEA